ncbi:MAG: hypothetical protein ACRDST_06185 [Pseudonocardiaceae bacterium]
MGRLDSPLAPLRLGVDTVGQDSRIALGVGLHAEGGGVGQVPHVPDQRVTGRTGEAGYHLMGAGEITSRQAGHDNPGLREMHGDLTEVPVTHRMRLWILDGSQQSSHSLHLLVECILTLLPVGYRFACDHVSPLGSVAQRVAQR